MNNLASYYEDDFYAVYDLLHIQKQKLIVFVELPYVCNLPAELV